MINLNKWLLCLLSCFLPVLAQPQHGHLSAADMENYSLQSEQLIRFLEETLNFIGDPNATVQEKEIVINESYLKFFRDEHVQIEDDLDENREIPLNKDVQAYLKDIDFFFSEVAFAFELNKIEQMSGESGELIFRAELNRRLNGITIQGDTVNTLRKRFVEINLDPFRKDLKIASIYTNRLNEREELRNWWNTMPIAWKRYFGSETWLGDTLRLDDVFAFTHEALVLMKPHQLIRRDTLMVMGPDTLSITFKHLLHGRPPDTLLVRADTLGVFRPDTIPADMQMVYSTLKKITQTKTIDIAYKQQFESLEPLAQLSDLELVDFSHTLIADLLPLRNLNKLDAIYMSGTAVSDLTPLQYSVNIKEIYCHNTAIEDLSPISGFRQLEKLYCFNTNISSLSPLAGLSELVALRAAHTHIDNIGPLSAHKALRLLDISHTKVGDLNPLAGLAELQMLNFEHTAVRSLDALRGLKSLSIVQFSNTEVVTLTPLSGLPELHRVYCDNTGISSSMAIRFMRENPGSLVIFETEELSAWWENLPIYWKAILSEQTQTSINPGTEELHEIINIQSLDLSNNHFLQNLQAVARLSNLSYLSLSKTEIVDLSALLGLNELRELDLSNTRISDLSPLQSLLALELLNIENTRVESLEPLENLGGLRLILADGSRLSRETVDRFCELQPHSLLVWQTESLQNWWSSIPDRWRDVFETYVPVHAKPTARQLHMIARLRNVEFGGINFVSLEPLRKLHHLETLSFSTTNIRDLEPISKLSKLNNLNITDNPISKLDPLRMLTGLQALNIENTPVSDIDPLSELRSLRKLNVSGTQIRNLKPLSELNKLEDLSFYNTRVRRSAPVEDLPALRHVKCYNTRLSSRRVNNWSEKRPELNILYY